LFASYPVSKMGLGWRAHFIPVLLMDPDATRSQMIELLHAAGGETLEVFSAGTEATDVPLLAIGAA